MSDQQIPSVVMAGDRELKVLGMDGIDRFEAYLRETGRAEPGQFLNAAMLEAHCENPANQAFVLGTAADPTEKDWRKRRKIGEGILPSVTDPFDRLNLCHSLLCLVPRIADSDKRIRFYVKGEPLHQVMAEVPAEGLAAADPTGSPG